MIIIFQRYFKREEIAGIKTAMVKLLYDTVNFFYDYNGERYSAKGTPRYATIFCDEIYDIPPGFYETFARDPLQTFVFLH